MGGAGNNIPPRPNLSHQLLTAPEALAQPTQAKRFMVELASSTLDFEEVTTDTKSVDVCVTEEAAIPTLLQAAGHLNGWRIVSHWVPESCDCF